MTATLLQIDTQPFNDIIRLAGIDPSEISFDLDPERGVRLAKPVVKIITLTPELAELLLSRPAPNRNANELRCRTWARLMEKDLWTLNSDALSVDIFGCLQNGQHRCRGVIYSGKSIPVILLLGAEVEAQDVTDVGMSRTLAQQLQIHEFDCPATLASAVTWMNRMERGITVVDTAGGSTTPLPICEALPYIEAHPELIEESKMVEKYHRRFPFKGSAGAWTALYHHFCLLDPEMTEDFMESLASGVGLAVDSPIYLLRERLIKESRTNRPISTTLKMAFIIKAWNFYRDGASIKLLRFAATGAAAETFPVPR